MSAPPWPPIIGTRGAPLWVRVRDVAITIVAWALLAWWTRGALLLVWDWFTPPYFEINVQPIPDWGGIWTMLAPYIALAFVLVSWLAIWAVKRRAVLRRQFDPHQPAALALDMHAAHWGLSTEDVTRLRSLPVATVRFDEAGVIVAGQGFAGDGLPRSEPSSGRP